MSKEPTTTKIRGKLATRMAYILLERLEQSDQILIDSVNKHGKALQRAYKAESRIKELEAKLEEAESKYLCQVNTLDMATDHVDEVQADLDKARAYTCRLYGRLRKTVHRERVKHNRIREMKAELAIAEVNVVEWRHCAKVNEGLKISAEQANANLSAALLGAGEKINRLTSRGFEDLHDENERLKSKLKKTEKLKQDYFEQCGVLRDIINRAKVDPNSDQANESVIDNSYTGQIAQQSRTIRIAQSLLRIADCPNCGGTGSCGIEGVGLLPCQWCEEKQAILSQDD